MIVNSTNSTKMNIPSKRFDIRLAPLIPGCCYCMRRSGDA